MTQSSVDTSKNTKRKLESVISKGNDRPRVKSMITKVGVEDAASPTKDMNGEVESPAKKSFRSDNEDTPNNSPRSQTKVQRSPVSPKNIAERNARNRRMLGGLMGHLARATTELKSKVWQDRLQKRSEKHDAILKKQQEESRRLKEKFLRQEEEKKVAFFLVGSVNVPFFTSLSLYAYCHLESKGTGYLCSGAARHRRPSKGKLFAPYLTYVFITDILLFSAIVLKIFFFNSI